MIRAKNISRLALLAALLAWMASPDVGAFNTGTHERLNGRAADVSSLDGQLKRLGYARGLLEQLNGETVRGWIQIGGRAEDEFAGNELLGAAFRSVHHFHNPLFAWDRAGLDALSVCPPFLLRGEASVRWAQDPNQGVSGRAAWQDARRRFREALTLGAKTDRDIAFADTFKLLGQQMHLIADLAVPAHTRNDAHCPLPEGFEAWASRDDIQALITSIIAGPPLRPGEGIYTVGVPIADAVATLPVARLWDTDRYDGTNPVVTLEPAIGLAEYTNANFFSDDTVFRGEFPYPAGSSVELGPVESEPRRGEPRRYFRKVRDGEVVDHLAVPSALYHFLPAALRDRKKGLDDKVFADYAAKLLPRAVGYSAALLDYFFRGRVDARVDIRKDAVGLHATARFVNLTPDETMSGTFALYSDTPDGVRMPLGSWNLALQPNEESGPLEVSPLPADTAPLPWLAVFRGDLGNEPQESVAAGLVASGAAFVGINRSSSPGSECQSGFAFDESGALFGVPLPAVLVALKVDGAYIRHRTGFFDCNQPGGWIVEPASAEVWPLLYRTPGGVPGRTLAVTWHSGPFNPAGCGYSSLEGQISGPGTVEVVEFEPPAMLADFYRYTVSNPPEALRVIGTIVPGQTQGFGVGEARFFGFRIVENPPPAILGPLFVPYDTPGATRSSATPSACVAILELGIE